MNNHHWEQMFYIEHNTNNGYKLASAAHCCTRLLNTVNCPFGACNGGHCREKLVANAALNHR